MIRTLHTFYGWFALLLLIAAPICSAATVATQEGTGTFPVTTTNNLLINNLGSAVYTGTSSAEGYADPAGSNVLYDGAFGSTTPSGGPATVATVHTNATATYNLNITTNPTGYIVNRIEVFGGWNDAGRDRQRYDVFYQPIGGGNFVQIASVNFNPVGGGPSNTFVTLTDLGIDTRAVRAIRFTFPDQENGYDGYREISVFGTVAAPTVSTPTVTPATGFYDNNVNVTITQTEAGGTTYYTTDGTEPTSTNGTLLVGASTSFNIDTNTTRVSTIRAQTFRGGFLPADATSTYTGYNQAVSVTGDLPGLRCINYNTNGQLLPHDPITIITQQRRSPSFNGNNPGSHNSVTPRARDDNFGYRFAGYINIATSGVYRFYTNSDDGSRLFLDNVLIVENNFSQGFTERQGDVALDAGKHAFRVEFSQGGGGFGISSRYSDVNATNQVEYDESATGIFSTEEVIETPVITLGGGGSTFTGTGTVTITSVPANATIYYTTDGTTPTPDSYTGTLVSGGSFSIASTTTVKAIAKVPGAFDGGVGTATFTRNTAPADAPKLLYAKVISATQVDAVFDINMGAGAATAANYAINNGVNVTNAALDPNLKTVHLTLGGALNQTFVYTLTATGISSAAGAPIGTANTAKFRALPNGVYFERFYDGSINGGIASLLNLPAYPNTPTNRDLLLTFDFPENRYGDNYGSRLRAYLIAPETGLYTFRIASDDNSRLFVSTDTNPANVVSIAGVPNWTPYRNFTTFNEDGDADPFNDQYGTITLTAGQSYYIEAIMTEGGGGDHLTVQWALPSAPTNYADIPSSSLLAFSTAGLTSGANANGMLRERYDGIGGTAIPDLTNNPKYPGSPDVVDFVPTFESPQNPALGDNYGLRLSGFYTAPATGNFNFYVCGDDDCELYFSPDENPANATRICFKVGGPYGNRDWQTTGNAKSANIALVSGTRYYVYALMKEGGGGDGVAVTVLPTGTDPVAGTTAPIPGTDLKPGILPLQIVSQTTTKRVRFGTSTSIAVSAAGGLTQRTFQWFKNGTKINGQNASTLALNNVTGADTATYTCEVYGSSDGLSLSVLTSAAIQVQVFADIAIDTATLAQTYDSTPRIVTATSTPVGLAYSVTYNGAPQAINAGTYPIVVSATGGVEAFANGSLVVSPVSGAVVSLTAQGGTILYDGATHGLSFTTTPPNLTVNVTYNGSATVPKDAGTYAVHAEINDTNAVGNPIDDDTLIISKVNLTVAANAMTRVYGDTSAVSPTFTITGYVNSETSAVITGSPTLTTSVVPATAAPADPGTDVGIYPITIVIGSLAATNYNFIGFTGNNFTVTKRPLDLQATSISLEYGVPTPSTLPFSVVAASLAPGDVEADALTGGQPVVTSTRTTLSPVGTYPITLTPGTLVFTNNYQLGTTTGGSITVTPTTTASLTVPATTVTYNGNPQGVTPTTTPAGLNANITYNGSATVPTNAGTYAVIATINDPNAAGNPSGNGTLVINKATATVGVFNLFQSENGTPRPVMIVTTPAGLNVDVTYNGSATAPTAPGTYAVVATVNEPNYQGTTNATLRVGGPPPVITSALTGTPNPVQVGKTVTFSIAATHPLNMPLTISYNYGDGTSDATGVHVYTFPQIATVTASVSDGVNTITSTIQVLVVSAASPDGDLDGDGINNSIDDDDDGDGLSDAFEEAAGSSPLDAGNSPLTDPSQGKNPGPLDVKKMSIKLSFAKTLTDSITISGNLPVKAGFTGANQKVVVDVGGVIKSFTLTSKFAAKTATDSIKIGVKAKKGVVAAQTAKYTIKVGKGTFSTALADDGLGNENAKNKSTTVRVDVLFNGQYLRKLVPQIYTAKQGTSGRTK